MPLNMKVVSLDKMHNMKVFIGNLENATKVPADIGGQRGVQGV
jgi:hypothetical protein